MKWKSHAAITRTSCRALGIPEYYEAIMVDGAVEPDRSPVMTSRGGSARRRVAHHGSSDRAIFVLLWKARASFLKGDDEHACRHLGRALHYVQDRCVAKGRNWADHNAIEGQISQMAVPMVRIEEGIERSRSSPGYVRACVRSIEPSREPDVALCQASFITSTLICAVLGETEAQEQEGPGARRSFMLRSITILASLMVSAAIIFLAMLSGFVASLVLLALPCAIVAFSESRYGRAKESAEWNGEV